MTYLFGDILAVTVTDVIWVWAGGVVVLAGLAAIWRPLLSITVHEDLARVDGIPVTRIRFLFMLLLSIVIAVAMKIVGVLLILSLLIIPPAGGAPICHDTRTNGGIGRHRGRHCGCRRPCRVAAMGYAGGSVDRRGRVTALLREFCDPTPAGGIIQPET